MSDSIDKLLDMLSGRRPREQALCNTSTIKTKHSDVVELVVKPGTISDSVNFLVTASALDPVTS